MKKRLKRIDKVACDSLDSAVGKTTRLDTSKPRQSAVFFSSNEWLQISLIFFDHIRQLPEDRVAIKSANYLPQYFEKDFLHYSPSDSRTMQLFSALISSDEQSTSILMSCPCTLHDDLVSNDWLERHLTFFPNLTQKCGAVPEFV